MTGEVFGHPWLVGLFGDTETADWLTPATQLSHMIQVELSYTEALGKTGAVPVKIAHAAAEHIQSVVIDLPDIAAGTAMDGVPIPALVHQLKRGADPEIHAVIHQGMTSQDVIDTALVLSLKGVISLFEQRHTELSEAFSTLIKTDGNRTLTGRTRMQYAREIRVADRVQTWLDPLDVNMERIRQIKPRLLQLQLGGPVGNRQEIGEKAPEIARDMASALGLKEPTTAWHTQRAAIVEFASWLALVTGTLGKLGQDISLMSQQGIDEIALSECGVSSAMPHKNNPVLAELLVTLARFNATQISGMHQSMIHEQERSGSAWALEWMLLPQMIMATGRSLSAAQQVCETITEIGKA